MSRRLKKRDDMAVTIVTRDMRDIDRVCLEAFIHPVKLGCKPAAEVDIENKNLDEALDIISERGLLYSIRRRPGSVLSQVHFFEKPHLKNVIENAPVFNDPLVEHWYWGKLYGYSEEAIASYLLKQGLTTSGAGRERVGVVVKPDFGSAVLTHITALPRLLTCCGHVFHLLSKILKNIVLRRIEKLEGRAHE